MGDNTTEIKHRINQTRKAINALNSIWWPKNVTQNRKLYIYQTVIQNSKNSNGMDTSRKKKKRTSKKNVDRRNTSCHGNKEFGTR